MMKHAMLSFTIGLGCWILLLGCRGGRDSEPPPTAIAVASPTVANPTAPLPAVTPTPSATPLIGPPIVKPVTHPPVLQPVDVGTVDSVETTGTWHNYPLPADIGGLRGADLDTQGRIWLGTTTGLLRFDPQAKTWSLYQTTHGLPNNWINTLLVDEDTVWAGTQGGLGILSEGNWQHYGPANGFPGGDIQAIVADSMGGKWVATDEALLRFDGQGWAVIADAPPGIQKMAVDMNGHLWFSNLRTLGRFDGQTWHVSSASQGSLYINVLSAGSDGGIWVGSGACILTPSDCVGAGLSRVDGQTRTTYWAEGRSSGPGNIVYSINFDPAGHSWVGLPGLVKEFDGQTWIEHFSTDGWLGGTVHAILFPNTEERVFVTPAGLSYLKEQSPLPQASQTKEVEGRRWTSYTTAQGLVDNRVTAIAITADGLLWIGTEGGISRFDGQTWTNYTTQDGLLNNYVTALAIDQQGRVWAGLGRECPDHLPECLSGSLSVFDGQIWQPVGPDEGLLGQEVTALAVDQANHLWVGTDAGLSRLADGVWQTFQAGLGLSETHITALTIDEANRLWVGTIRGGLTQFDGQTWTPYLQPEPYNPQGDSVTGGYHITALASHQGDLWVGLGTGLSFSSVRRFDGTTWHRFGIEDGVLGYGVSSIAIDQQGRIWTGSLGGVNEFSDPIWTYNTTNGLIRESVSVIVVDRDNNKWIGTAEGGIQKLEWGSKE